MTISETDLLSTAQRLISRREWGKTGSWREGVLGEGTEYTVAPRKEMVCLPRGTEQAEAGELWGQAEWPPRSGWSGIRPPASRQWGWFLFVCFLNRKGEKERNINLIDFCMYPD